MSLYDELLQFQILPHARNDWAEYRTAVTAYLLQHTEPQSSVAVFGAGRCNDIDLREFRKHFSSVTLIDSNRDSMQEALAAYDLTDDPSMHLFSCDFTGITPQDYRNFSDALTSFCQVNGSRTDIRLLADYAVSGLDSLYVKADQHNPDFGTGCFDYSMAFGVHSQINSMAAWIFSAFAAQLGQQEPSVESRIIRANDRLIPRLNDVILKATKTAAFFGCELKNTAVSGSIQGACQCIEDLHKRGIVTEQAVTLWPFDQNQNIIYQMLIQKASCTASSI